MQETRINIVLVLFVSLCFATLLFNGFYEEFITKNLESGY